LTNNDWIVAYNNGIIVGARKWNGRYTDIPVMGDDGTSATIGYCKVGDIPTFKLFSDETGDFIDLNSNSTINSWTDLGVNILNQLNESIIVPEHFEFSYPYPNPFNPSTLIKFALPKASNVKVIAYDVAGRQVDKILNKKLDAGHHQMSWKPISMPSGIYFINIQTETRDLTRKVMYIK
jgi:hypothetical protein